MTSIFTINIDQLLSYEYNKDRTLADIGGHFYQIVDEEQSRNSQGIIDKDKKCKIK